MERAAGEKQSQQHEQPYKNLVKCGKVKEDQLKDHQFLSR
jgi:hypothetical protein